MIVAVQHFPFDTANTVGKAVRVVTGHGCHGDDVTGQAIEHNYGSRFKAESPRSVIVQINIDGQLDGLAGRIWPCGQLPHDFAARGNFGPLGTGFAL